MEEKALKIKEATQKYCAYIENSLYRGELNGFRKFEMNKKCDAFLGVNTLEIRISIKVNDISMLKKLGFLKED